MMPPLDEKYLATVTIETITTPDSKTTRVQAAHIGVLNLLPGGEDHWIANGDLNARGVDALRLAYAHGLIHTIRIGGQNGLDEAAMLKESIGLLEELFVARATYENLIPTLTEARLDAGQTGDRGQCH